MNISSSPGLLFKGMDIKRYLLIIAGLLSLITGIIGIFLPILPTTPFLLLASGLFLKSSKSLYVWLTSHKVLGVYIENYLRYRAVTLKSKIVSIVFLWVVILISMFFATEALWLRITLTVIACGVTIHLVSLKTLTKEMMEGKDRKE